MTKPLRIVVIGGGIAGLAAAFTVLDRTPGAEVVVLEAASRVGGKLATAEVAGVEVDTGAEALLARRPEGLDLLRQLGLDDQLIVPQTTAASVWAGAAPHPLPARTMLGIPADLDAARASGLLGPAALARLAAEPDAPPLPPIADDLAVGELVRSRLGDEVLDRLVEPLLGGVYAGHSNSLSLRASMPALAARLARGGSLIRAAQEVVAAGAGASGPVFASLTGGLGQLAYRLGDWPGLTVRTGVTVRAIARTQRGFALECGPVGQPELVDAGALIVATPPAKAARLLGSVAPVAAAELATIDTASVAIITLAFPELALPPGSGLLVGAREALTVKAVTLSSQKWPLPAGGLTVLRASIGRAGQAELLQRDDAALIATVRRDLRALYGIDAKPVDGLVTRWGGGLPQYAVGHLDKVARIRAAVAAVPGLAVCGASYDGVGIPACIASARAAVGQLLAPLAPRGQ